MKKLVVVNDFFQKNYKYYLTEEIGKNFDRRFKPELTPEEMLRLGVFGGKYMNDCKKEFPESWFEKAKLSPEGKNIKLNLFCVDASMDLEYWIKKGWIYYEDPRGWFQWYCRYYMGRRLLQEDKRQIGRWLSYKRHKTAVIKNCMSGDFSCRKKQRQSLIHWAYDSRKI